jgi:hypothetical protein
MTTLELWTGRHSRKDFSTYRALYGFDPAVVDRIGKFENCDIIISNQLIIHYVQAYHFRH